VSHDTDWLSTVPSHWGRKKLKFLATLKSGESITADSITEEGDYPVFGGNGLRGYTAAYTHCGHYVLIGRQGALCGNINYAAGCFWASEHAVVATPQEYVDVRWLGELLRSMSLNQYSQSAAQPGLAVDVLAHLEVPAPPLQEQRAIADFLDRETARLDALVAAKERLLELLAEKRRALITHAVTCGMDPGTPLQDSGIPWLGETPAHWEVVPLRFLCEFTSGATPDTGNTELWHGDIPWVSPKDMKSDEIVDAQDHVSQAALTESSLRLIAPVAVLIVVRGMILAHSFPVATTTRAVTINQDMKALHCRSSIDPYFLRNFLRGMEPHLVALADSSAHGTRKIETELLGRFEICVPPITEQHAIVAHLKRANEQTDSLRAATERTLALLKERRAALISAAVTGQLDIPEGGT
jgi:type I restriction enzyme, S subunit